jgi:hypothetical protein
MVIIKDAGPSVSDQSHPTLEGASAKDSSQPDSGLNGKMYTRSRRQMIKFYGVHTGMIGYAAHRVRVDASE